MLAAACAKSDFCQSNTAFFTTGLSQAGVTGVELSTLSQGLDELGLPPTMVFSNAGTGTACLGS